MKVIILSLLVAVVAAKTVENQEVSGRIIGGNKARPGQWPFVAAVHHAGSFICGGALFSVQWAITSADCVQAYIGELPPQVYISIGGITNSGLEPGKVEWPLDHIVIHPDYESREDFVYNNIALLHCITPVPVGPQIQPIQLPVATEVIVPGTKVLFAGWGGKDDASPVTDLEYVTDSLVMITVRCSTIIGLLMGKTELCTEPSELTTACKFDHGSPLFRFDPVYGTILLGINTYAPCTAAHLPTVFANIVAYIEWISTITG